MGSIADLFVNIVPRPRGFGAALKSGVEGEAKGAGTSTGATFGKSFVAGVGAVFAAGEIGKFFRLAFNEAQEAAKVTKLTEAAIKSTGQAAHVTAGQVGDMAASLSELSGIDDEVIQSGENVLLTFTRVRNEAGKGNDVFNQATAAALDMSVALGKDLQGSITAVGKALNDPIAGITALRKVGVAFTEEQREQIKVLVESGKTLEAQKIILAELTTEFGGAAEAAATPADKASVAWGNFAELIGGEVMPELNDLLQWGLDNQQWLIPTAIGIGKIAVVIGAVVVATKAWNAVQSVLGVGLDSTATKARRVAVGLTGLLIAAQAVGAAFHNDLNPQVDALAQDLERFADKGDLSGEALRIIGGDAGDLGRILNGVAQDGVTHFLDQISNAAISLVGFQGPIDEAKEKAAALDQALAQMVQSGHADAAAEAFKRIWQEAQKQNIDLSALQAAFPAYIAAAQHATTANTALAQATEDASKAGEDLLDTWNELNGTMISADKAMLEATDAIQAVKDEFKNGTKAIDQNSGATLKNRIALENAAQAAIEAAAAYVKNGGSAAEAAGIVQRFKDQAVAATGATGNNANAVRELANQLFRIPANVSSTVLITTIKRTINEESTVQHSRRAGGPSNFEDGGIVKFFATGGMENHIAQILAPGAIRVWNEPEAGGEAYIPMSPTKRDQSTAILSQVARQFGYGLVAGGGTPGNSGGDWGGILGALRRIERAVWAVAPGVGNEINGMGGAIRREGRAR